MHPSSLKVFCIDFIVRHKIKNWNDEIILFAVQSQVFHSFTPQIDQIDLTKVSHVVDNNKTKEGDDDNAKEQKQKEREQLVEGFLNSTRPQKEQNNHTDNNNKNKDVKMQMEHFGDDSVEGYGKPKEKEKAKGNL